MTDATLPPPPEPGERVPASAVEAVLAEAEAEIAAEHGGTASTVSTGSTSIGGSGSSSSKDAASEERS